MLIRFELRKLYRNLLFLCSAAAVIFISSFFLYIQFSGGYVYVDTEGNRDAYNGFRKVSYDRQVSSEYEGRVIDDDFLLDVQKKEVAYLYDPEEHPIVETSLYNYYHHLLPDTEIHMGELTKKSKEIFGDDPPVYLYTENWRQILNALSKVQTIAAAVLILITAKAYSDEYSQKTFVISSASRLGRKRAALNKLTASYVLAVTVYIIAAIFTIVIFGVVFGFDNLGADIRVVSSGAYISMRNGMTCVNLLSMELLTGIVSTVTCVSLGLLFSSLMSNTLLGAAIAELICLFPLIFRFDSLESEMFRRINILWPTNMTLLPLNDWNSYGFSLPVFGLSGLICAAVITVCSSAAVFFYTRHRIR